MVKRRYTDAQVQELVSTAGAVRDHIETWFGDTWDVQDAYFQMKVKVLNKALEVFEEAK